MKNENIQTSLTTQFVQPEIHEGAEKAAELEKTVFILKRVVEKLQAKNKRLLNYRKPCALTDRSVIT